MPRRVQRWGLVMGLAALPGCYDGADPLDPELLAEIARTQGDAQGIALSGIYEGDFNPIECGCEDFDQASQLSLCAVVNTAGLFGMPSLFQVEVIQADGTIRIQPEAAKDLLTGESLLPTLYGPLGADGDVVAGGVLQADALVVKGQIFGRADGTLTGPPRESVLQLDYQQRNTVTLIEFSLETLDLDDNQSVQNIDCRERIEMDLTWHDELPLPSDE